MASEGARDANGCHTKFTTCKRGSCNIRGVRHRFSFPLALTLLAWPSVGVAAVTVEAVSQQAFARGGVKTGPSDVQVDYREVSNQAIGLFSTSGRVTSQHTPVDTFDAQVSFTADSTPGRFLLNPSFQARAAGSASAQTQVSGSYTFLVDTSARARIRVDFSTGLASSSNYAEIVESGTSRSITRVAFEQGRNEVFVALAPGKYQFTTSVTADACGPSNFPCPHLDIVANASIDLMVAEDPQIAPALPRVGPWLLLGTLCVVGLLGGLRAPRRVLT